MLSRQELELFPGYRPVYHPYLGRRVTVVLDREVPGRPITVTGTLLRLTEDYSVEVQPDGDVVHYCWPALEIVPAQD